MINYQRRTHILTIVLGLALLTSCKKKNGTAFIETTHPVTDSIKISDLIEWKDLGDTLKIVTTDDIGYFPFGKLSLEQDITQHFEGYTYARTAADRFYVIKGKNKIEFYMDTELNVNQITKGEINDSDLMFVNNFHVGTPAKDILKYFRIRSTEAQKKYSVVMIETGLTGITHFYQIRNSRIQRITFETDYVFEDKKNWPFNPI